MHTWFFGFFLWALLVYGVARATATPCALNFLHSMSPHCPVTSLVPTYLCLPADFNTHVMPACLPHTYLPAPCLYSLIHLGLDAPLPYFTVWHCLEFCPVPACLQILPVIAGLRSPFACPCLCLLLPAPDLPATFCLPCYACPLLFPSQVFPYTMCLPALVPLPAEFFFCPLDLHCAHYLVHYTHALYALYPGSCTTCYLPPGATHGAVSTCIILSVVMMMMMMLFFPSFLMPTSDRCLPQWWFDVMWYSLYDCHSYAFTPVLWCPYDEWCLPRCTQFLPTNFLLPTWNYQLFTLFLLPYTTPCLLPPGCTTTIIPYHTKLFYALPGLEGPPHTTLLPPAVWFLDELFSAYTPAWFLYLPYSSACRSLNFCWCALPAPTVAFTCHFGGLCPFCVIYPSFVLLLNCSATTTTMPFVRYHATACLGTLLLPAIVLTCLLPICSATCLCELQVILFYTTTAYLQFEICLTLHSVMCVM